MGITFSLKGKTKCMMLSHSGCVNVRCCNNTWNTLLYECCGFLDKIPQTEMNQILSRIICSTATQAPCIVMVLTRTGDLLVCIDRRQHLKQPAALISQPMPPTCRSASAVASPFFIFSCSSTKSFNLFFSSSVQRPVCHMGWVGWMVHITS